MKIKTAISIVATATLLALAFPGLGLWPLAYVGLIPMLFWSRGRETRELFWGGMAAGLIFHGITLSWFASLTYWVGGIALVGVGFLFLLFSLLWGLVWVGKRYVEEHVPAVLAAIFPALWVLMEYIENHIFTGFGWGSLGYTQWKLLPVAQLASIGSVYSVSFFVVLINVLIYQSIINIRPFKKVAIPGAAIILFGVGIPLWGLWQMQQPDMSSPLKVGVIQPNFSLDVKWNSEYALHMLWVQEKLTEEVAAKGADFVIWPESALYGYLVNEKEKIGKIVRKDDIYLLMGSNHYDDSSAQRPEDVTYYNSAFLLDPKGNILGRYDKRHLAPFGEYVPMANLIGFVGKIVPAISDFTPGRKSTLFDINGRKFSVLICFENSFPHLVRESAQGADFLVQITNDGWFGRSSQPWQDLAIAVFRSIENGTTLIRCANTGISCFVDPWGRVSGMVRNEWGEAVFARGTSGEPVSTVPHATLYKSYGDVFVFACAALIAIAGGIILYRIYRKRAKVVAPPRVERSKKKQVQPTTAKGKF
jgi:apolipoprotein N-acyltransferase